ncbi:MAG: carboxymuconolactone decarboxylase family protein [Bdellovibrionota bacterium]
MERTRRSQTEYNPDIKKYYDEIEKEFGFVPEFVKAFPVYGFDGAWEEVKALYLNQNTVLPQKLKDLISISIDSQIPCGYCGFMDQKFGEADGVTLAEKKEAIAMAALTRHWSSFLNGSNIDELDFECEVDLIFDHLGKQVAGRKEIHHEDAVPSIETAGDAYEDIKVTLGVVPEFMQRFPRFAIAGAWKEMKHLQLNPNTSLSPKHKELIGLAVASQIPCKYCTYFHTLAARFHGASDDEISETLAIAGLARHWSAVINGAMLDVEKFRSEIQRMVQTVSRKMAA